MAIIARTVNAGQVISEWYIKDDGKSQKVIAVSSAGQCSLQIQTHQAISSMVYWGECNLEFYAINDIFL